MGSFFLVFMYLSSTEEKTQFTKDAAVQTIILAGSYLGAMLLAGIKLYKVHASPVNPAIAFATLFWNPTKNNVASAPIFLGSSMLGSVLALMFFRFVYKKTTQAIEIMEDEEDEANDDSKAQPLMG
jgi:glycerol uptake facilitator-like aquaporin